jgi:hypothetical protein
VGNGFDPASVPAVGRWFGRGHLILHPERPLPHTLTVQEYLFDRIRDGQRVTKGISFGSPQGTRG